MTHDNVTDIVERRYLLQKRGLYYRPDRCGYTGIKDHAGRYFESDATPPDVVAIHEDEAPDFSPSCYEDLARQHLQEQNASLRKQLEDARDVALEQAARVAEEAPITGPTLSSWINANESPMGATRRHIATAIRALKGKS